MACHLKRTIDLKSSQSKQPLPDLVIFHGLSSVKNNTSGEQPVKTTIETLHSSRSGMILWRQIYEVQLMSISSKNEKNSFIKLFNQTRARSSLFPKDNQNMTENELKSEFTTIPASSPSAGGC
jgi:hypothetical protein